MDELKGARVVVVGGGVIGLSVALSAAWRGANVQVYEPREIGDNASGVAGGMLAPAFEACLDPLAADYFPLLRAARDRWPAFADKLGAPLLNRSGALRLAIADDAHLLEPLVCDLKARGAAVERLTNAQARRMQPMLSSDTAGAVYTPEDWRLDPLAALHAMVVALQRSGGRIVRQTASPSRLDDTADAIVLATGAQSVPWLRHAPTLALLQPIKGQILHFDAGPGDGPVVRGASGYIVPQARGAVVGASMEAGVSDTIPDPAVLTSLRSTAAELFPHLGKARARGLAGVRAATPDGLPLVGEAIERGDSRPRLFLAIGARRNGWLLAPAIGEILVAHLTGETADDIAACLSPARFSRLSAPPQTRTAAPAG